MLCGKQLFCRLGPCLAASVGSQRLSELGEWNLGVSKPGMPWGLVSGCHQCLGGGDKEPPATRTRV